MHSIILFLLIPFFNSIMDTLEFHYDKSIFSKWKPINFWNPNSNIPKFLGWFKPDAWHITKFLMIVSIILFGTTYISLFHNILIDTLFYCILWYIDFEGFFSKILIKKAAN